MQLTIFDVGEHFDSDKANWINVQSAFRKCYVMAIPPKRLISPIQSQFRNNSIEFLKETEEWTDYVHAVCRTGVDWVMAKKMLAEHQKEHRPLKMCVFEGFEPSNVTEYL